MRNWIGSSSQFHRTDGLTGVGNSLGFFEWLLSRQKAGFRAPFTLISLGIAGLAELNERSGHAAGDTALRWAAIVLTEEADSNVYRIGPDEFVLVLTGGSLESRNARVKRATERLNTEATQVGLPSPAARVAVVHYGSQEDPSPGRVLSVFYGAISQLKKSPGAVLKAFDAADTAPVRDLAWVVDDVVDRMVSLGLMLDESHHLAYTDATTGLPNMNAAVRQLETTLAQAQSTGKPFAILLVDGDDLKRYNEISYVAGDEMIRRLGSTLQAEIRPGDFLARWRMGDEFFVLLPGTSIGQCVAVGKRLCAIVQRVSREWEIPVTVSSGVSGYPEHGTSATDLLHRAETALDRAKDLGKNKVVVAE